ncbi:TWiK family of potassium channels protein 7 [Toxocara canis]|uniref:TWiK family of potassium channels protein 7 n=1 Tax=Toxocara canis TaxID=6265 RepID=A0A0B2VHL8_TOXCA|nr:TWiK family of potassium channels protein 7 [Toxocara canis]
MCKNAHFSAERLNLYLDRQDGEGGILEQIEEEPRVGFEPKTRKEKIKQNLRIVLPHVGLVILSAAYTILGAAIFHHFEMPYEIHIRNETAHRIEALKQKIIDDLWELAHHKNDSGAISFDNWSDTAHRGMNNVIRDVFVDYTKNYMTPDDIIHGAGPIKWSFGSSIFFSWTAITTIGYGHIVPRTNEGRVACLMYALLGIPLILVTIADMGRFLSGGIIWVHNALGKLRLACTKKCAEMCKAICCCRCLPSKKKNEPPKSISGIDLVNAQKRLLRRKRPNHIDNISEAGTFEDISEIHTQGSEKTPSEDTRARADDLEEYEPVHERRVSALFVLVIMIGYTAGGAFLMQLWENWTFMESFYFCFVTVTTIGFGDIVPQNVDFLPATLAYIIVGLIITTMCIDLVGSAYIRDIHFYGRSLGRSFMTIGGKVVHLGEVFGYVAFLQKNYGLTPEQLDKLAHLPEEYLLDCLINGRQPDLNWIAAPKGIQQNRARNEAMDAKQSCPALTLFLGDQGGRPYVPPDIYYFKWIEHPRTLSFASERVLASMESLDLNTSKCSTARTLTPREYYQRILLQYCKQVQPDDAVRNVDHTEM